MIAWALYRHIKKNVVILTDVSTELETISVRTFMLQVRYEFLLWTSVCQLYWRIEISVHEAIEKWNLWGFSGYKTIRGTCSIVSLLCKLLLVGDFFIIPQWRLSQVSKGCLPVHSMCLFSPECVFLLTFFKKAWEAIIRNSTRLAVFVSCFSFWSLPGFHLCVPLWASLCSYFFLDKLNLLVECPLPGDERSVGNHCAACARWCLLLV